MKKRGFTLIELIAVLVILAILVLIVTPLVMNIIRKARIAADKRSIDAYGRSIELAIANYLLDNGDFPTSISQLTIEYSGDEVVCSTTQLKSDSSVYLTGCTVGGRSVDYDYGTEETVTYDTYSVGDEVSYNNVDYRVIANSGANESTVTLLKSKLLTVAEVNTYGGVGTANNHVNMYAVGDTTSSFYQKANNINGYGGMAYYSSSTCGYVNNTMVRTGCTTDYEQSDVKYVVDAWKTAQVPEGLEARLITYDELVNDLECTSHDCSNSLYNWLYNGIYAQWTMTPYNVSSGNTVCSIASNGDVSNMLDLYSGYGAVRPVITIKKSALEN